MSVSRFGLSALVAIFLSGVAVNSLAQAQVSAGDRSVGASAGGNNVSANPTGDADSSQSNSASSTASGNQGNQAGSGAGSQTNNQNVDSAASATGNNNLAVSGTGDANATQDNTARSDASGRQNNRTSKRRGPQSNSQAVESEAVVEGNRNLAVSGTGDANVEQTNTATSNA